MISYQKAWSASSPLYIGYEQKHLGLAELGDSLLDRVHCCYHSREDIFWIPIIRCSLIYMLALQTVKIGTVITPTIQEGHPDVSTNLCIVNLPDERNLSSLYTQARSHILYGFTRRSVPPSR